MVIHKPNINIVTCILDEDRSYLPAIQDSFDDDFNSFIVPDDINNFIKLMSDDIHICILDYILGNNINGLELMKTILSKNPQCYVIMMSSQIDIDVVTEFYDLDGFRYIRKDSKDFEKKLIASIKKARTIIQRDLDFHFEMIDKFNKTQETFKNARFTIDNSIGCCIAPSYGLG